MITAVNGNFLIEPVLRTEKEREELKDRLQKSGLVMPESAGKSNNRDNFEGVPSTGYIRYIPESYEGELKVGMFIVFEEQNPAGFKHEGVTLFALKDYQIVAVVTE